MSTPDGFNWGEFDSLVEQARQRYAQHARGQRHKAPGAFWALDMIFNHLPDVNPVLASLIFGWIEGAFRRAELPEHEYDEAGDAHYVHVLHDDVHHTTEDYVHIDWTEDGRMVGIELMPGESKPARIEIQKEAMIPPETWAAIKAQFEAMLKEPPTVRRLAEEKPAHTRPGRQHTTPVSWNEAWPMPPKEGHS